uniref:DH domain-containing protein n=1 Tax=Panagrellus redivivus TaxID=6233 RepID=A0A7E4UYE9_PANRE
MPPILEKRRLKALQCPPIPLTRPSPKSSETPDYYELLLRHTEEQRRRREFEDLLFRSRPPVPPDFPPPSAPPEPLPKLPISPTITTAEGYTPPEPWKSHVGEFFLSRPSSGDEELPDSVPTDAPKLPQIPSDQPPPSPPPMAPPSLPTISMPESDSIRLNDSISRSADFSLPVDENAGTDGLQRSPGERKFKKGSKRPLKPVTDNNLSPSPTSNVTFDVNDNKDNLDYSAYSCSPDPSPSAESMELHRAAESIADIVDENDIQSRPLPPIPIDQDSFDEESLGEPEESPPSPKQVVEHDYETVIHKRAVSDHVLGGLMAANQVVPEKASPDLKKSHSDRSAESPPPAKALSMTQNMSVSTPMIAPYPDGLQASVHPARHSYYPATVTSSDGRKRSTTTDAAGSDTLKGSRARLSPTESEASTVRIRPDSKSMSLSQRSSTTRSYTEISPSKKQSFSSIVSRLTSSKKSDSSLGSSTLNLSGKSDKSEKEKKSSGFKWKSIFGSSKSNNSSFDDTHSIGGSPIARPMPSNAPLMRSASSSSAKFMTRVYEDPRTSPHGRLMTLPENEDIQTPWHGESPAQVSKLRRSWKVFQSGSSSSKTSPPSSNGSPTVRDRRVSIIGDVESDRKMWCVSPEVSKKLDSFIEQKVAKHHHHYVEKPPTRHPSVTLTDDDEVYEDEEARTLELNGNSGRISPDFKTLPRLGPFAERHRTPSELEDRGSKDTLSQPRGLRSGKCMKRRRPRDIHRRRSAHQIREYPGHADSDIPAALRVRVPMQRDGVTNISPIELPISKKKKQAKTPNKNYQQPAKKGLSGLFSLRSNNKKAKGTKNEQRDLANLFRPLPTSPIGQPVTFNGRLSNDYHPNAKPHNNHGKQPSIVVPLALRHPRRPFVRSNSNTSLAWHHHRRRRRRFSKRKPKIPTVMIIRIKPPTPSPRKIGIIIARSVGASRNRRPSSSTTNNSASSSAPPPPPPTTPGKTTIASAAGGGCFAFVLLLLPKRATDSNTTSKSSASSATSACAYQQSVDSTEMLLPRPSTDRRISNPNPAAVYATVASGTEKSDVVPSGASDHKRRTTITSLFAGESESTVAAAGAPLVSNEDVAVVVSSFSLTPRSTPTPPPPTIVSPPLLGSASLRRGFESQPQRYRSTGNLGCIPAALPSSDSDSDSGSEASGLSAKKRILSGFLSASFWNLLPTTCGPEQTLFRAVAASPRRSESLADVAKMSSLSSRSFSGSLEGRENAEGSDAKSWNGPQNDETHESPIHLSPRRPGRVSRSKSPRLGTIESVECEDPISAPASRRSSVLATVPEGLSGGSRVRRRLSSALTEDAIDENSSAVDHRRSLKVPSNSFGGVTPNSDATWRKLKYWKSRMSIQGPQQILFRERRASSNLGLAQEGGYISSAQCSLRRRRRELPDGLADVFVNGMYTHKASTSSDGLRTPLGHGAFFDDSPPSPQLHKSKWNDLELWVDEPENWSSKYAQANLKVSTTETKRQNIIYELYYTEKKHVRVIIFLQQAYQVGLRELKILSEDKLVELIPDVLDSMLDFHLNFLRRLRHRIIQKPIVETVSDIIVEEFGPDGRYVNTAVQAYTSFCLAKDDASALYQELTEKNHHIKKFFDFYETDPRHKKHSFKSCLLLIAQRLTKYNVLVQEISKYDHATASKTTKEASRTVQQFAHRINTELQRNDIQKRYDKLKVDIDKKSKGKILSRDFTFEDLVHDERVVLAIGETEYHTTTQNHKESISLTMVLFDDILVFLSHRGSNYVFCNHNLMHSVVPLKRVLVRVIPRTCEFHLVVTDAERPDMYKLSFPNKSQLAQWVDAIETAKQVAPEVVRFAPGRPPQPQCEEVEDPEEQQHSQKHAAWLATLEELFEKLKTEDTSLTACMERRMDVTEDINSHFEKMPTRSLAKLSSSASSSQLPSKLERRETREIEKVRNLVKSKLSEIREHRHLSLNGLVEAAQRCSILCTDFVAELAVPSSSESSTYIGGPAGDACLSSTGTSSEDEPNSRSKPRRVRTYHGTMDSQPRDSLRRHTTVPKMKSDGTPETDDEQEAKLDEEYRKLPFVMPLKARKAAKQILKESITLKLENEELRRALALKEMHIASLRKPALHETGEKLEKLRQKTEENAAFEVQLRKEQEAFKDKVARQMEQFEEREAALQRREAELAAAQYAKASFRSGACVLQQPTLSPSESTEMKALISKTTKHKRKP